MEVLQELSLVEKKKIVLDKIDTVLTTFWEIKKTLLWILETNKYLDASDKMRERQKILKTTSEEVKELMISIEKVKVANAHRTNLEVHEAHKKISENINTTIATIVEETRIRTIITLSENLHNLVEHLSKNIKTGIGLEYLVLSDGNKYTKIWKPINLDVIRDDVVGQVKTIDARMTDVSGIRTLIQYLDIPEKSPIMKELLDYVLGGKTYDQIKPAMEAHGIVIEEIKVHSLDGELRNEVKTPIPTPTPTQTQQQLTQPIVDEAPLKKAHQGDDDVHLEIIPINDETEPLLRRIFKVFWF